MGNIELYHWYGWRELRAQAEKNGCIAAESVSGQRSDLRRTVGLGLVRLGSMLAGSSDGRQVNNQN